MRGSLLRLRMVLYAHNPSLPLNYMATNQVPRRIRKVDPFFGVPIKYPLVVEGPKLGDLPSRSSRESGKARLLSPRPFDPKP